MLNIFAPCFQRNVKGEHEKVVDKVTLLHTSLDTVNTFGTIGTVAFGINLSKSDNALSKNCSAPTLNLTLNYVPQGE